MRHAVAAFCVVATLSSAAGALAAPSVEIRDAAARAVIAPEVRSDIEVVVLKPNPSLPLRVWRFSGRTFISGGLARRLRGCGTGAAGATVAVQGVGVVPYAELPQVVIRTPLGVHVFVTGAHAAVWGAVGKSDSLELSNAGCGDWEVGDVRGRLRVSLGGAGGVRAGEAGSAEVYDAAAGAISVHMVKGEVLAMTTGPGAIDIGETGGGGLSARVAGSGAVRVAGGRVDAMRAAVAGSGEVRLDGSAESLDASVVGSGSVRVGKVTGRVTRSVIGPGTVRVGS